MFDAQYVTNLLKKVVRFGGVFTNVPQNGTTSLLCLCFLMVYSIISTINLLYMQRTSTRVGQFFQLIRLQSQQ